MAIRAIWLWWPCGLDFEPSLCLTGPYAADEVEGTGTQAPAWTERSGWPRGDCSLGWGLLSSSQELSGARKEPLLCRTLLYSVREHES